MLRRNVAYDLWRVCRDQKLTVRKRLLKRGNHMALPAGMKVEVKFVDQDHPRASKWVIFRRIRERQV